MKRRRLSSERAIPCNAFNQQLMLTSRDVSQHGLPQRSYRSPTKTSIARFYPTLVQSTRTCTTPRSMGRILLDRRISALHKDRELKSQDSEFIQQISPEEAAFLQATAQKARSLDPDDTVPDDVSTAFESSDQPFRAGLESSSVNEVICEHDRLQPGASPPTEVADANEPQFPPSTTPIGSRVRSSTPSAGIDPRGVIEHSSLHRPDHHYHSHEESHTSTGGSSQQSGDPAQDDHSIPCSTPDRHSITPSDVAEPRLPSTPRQLGVEPPASKPAGLSFSSPRRMAKPRHTTSKSSPLKPKDTVPFPHLTGTKVESNFGVRRSLLDMIHGRAANESLIQGTNDIEATVSSSNSFPISDPLHAVQAGLSLRISAGDLKNQDQPNSHVLRYRDVEFTSADGIFVVHLRLFLNNDSLKVRFANVTHSPSWAIELRAWLEAPIADRTQASIAQAVVHFWDIFETRATCWYLCKNKFVAITDISGAMHDVSEDSVEKKESLHRDNSGDPGPELGYLVNDSCRFTDDEVLLVVVWNIFFTPSGKVTSQVSAHATFPLVWSNDSDHKDLERVDEVFTRLVRSGKSVYEASWCMIEALFPM